MAMMQRHEIPVDGVDPVVHLTVRVGLHAPAMARAFIRSSVELLGATATEDVVLLTSEAVTNSVVHAHTDSVEVSLYRQGDTVHVAITDCDPEEPEMRDPDPTRVGGFGVRLIDQLADDWGVAPVAGDGKCVWFEVALPEAAAALP